MSSTTVAPTGPCSKALEFEPIVQRHRRDLYSYAYRLSGNRHTADDLVQESLTRAWRSIGALQNRKAARCWLFTILRRENARRFERYEPVHSEIALENVDAKRRTYDTSTEAFVLRRAIRALPSEYREPLVLQVIYGYSQQEIAAQLGLTSAGVGTRLFRARQKLRAALGEWG